MDQIVCKYFLVYGTINTVYQVSVEKMRHGFYLHLIGITLCFLIFTLIIKRMQSTNKLKFLQ
jgi:hypothetical protein